MKKYLITGLILLIPGVFTILIVIFVLDLFTDPFLDLAKNIILQFRDTLPFVKHPNLLVILSRITVIILLCGFIFLLGFLARAFFFKSLIHWAQKLLSRIPFVKGIYNVSKDIVGSVFSSDKRTAFQKPVQVHFPSEEAAAVGFVTGEVPSVCQEKVSATLKPIFVPTAPHPISGYLVMVPESIIKEVDMTNEEAVKFTVSCGMIIPEENREQDQQLAQSNENLCSREKKGP